jgi:hypothetical protein
MKYRKRLLMMGGVLAMLAGALLAPNARSAQDATPEAPASPAAPVATDAPGASIPAGRPAHIHAGSCDALDPNPLFPLTNVALATGDVSGNDAATTAESSFTALDVALDDILADDHAVNVHLSPEEADVYVACGEIGGTREADGSLTIVLREQNDSGLTGVANLVPNPDNRGQTLVSVFLLGGTALPAAATTTPEADPDPDAEATAVEDEESEATPAG